MREVSPVYPSRNRTCLYATHWETAFLAGMVRTPAIKAMMASSASGRYACRHGLIFNPSKISDDIVMVQEHRDTLSDAWRQMRECLCDEKDLDLNDKKCSLLPLPDGVRFMKFLFRLTKTGKVVRTLDRSNITHARRRLRRLVAMVNNGDRMPEDAINSFNSWKAHASHGNSYHIIRRMQTCLQPIQFCRPTPCVNNVSP